MLCGKCNKPILCKCCGETEYSDYVDDGHKFIPSDCNFCKENPTYIDKDIMWYVKSIIEAFLILILIVCLIGFVAGVISIIIAIPLTWGKPLSYYPYPWLNNVMVWSVCIGFVNFLIMVSCDKEWREDYIDHSSVRNIEE